MLVVCWTSWSGHHCHRVLLWRDSCTHPPLPNMNSGSLLHPCPATGPSTCATGHAARGAWMVFTDTLLCHLSQYGAPLQTRIPYQLQHSEELVLPADNNGPHHCLVLPVPLTQHSTSRFVHCSASCQVNFTWSRLGLLRQSTTVYFDMCW